MGYEATKEMRVKLTFTEPILGTASADKEIYSSFIASKAPDAATMEEEIAAHGVDEVEKKAMTVFSRDEEGKPFLYDYQIKGFFKNSCGMLRNAPKSESSKIKAYKKYIDGLIFIDERRIPIKFEEDMGVLQRPLRASTAQGDRVALASSETCPVGSTIEFTILLFKPDLEAAVIEWLDYGRLNGIGQWHNGGYGRFTWRLLE